MVYDTDTGFVTLYVLERNRSDFDEPSYTFYERKLTHNDNLFRRTAYGKAD